MTDGDITIRLASSAAAVGATAWNACANPECEPRPHPFNRFEFFDAAESSGSATARTGWQPGHLIMERESDVVGILPMYLKSHSQGEYVFDHAWAEALERAGGDYYPKLQASVPFTPVTGKRFLIRAPEDRKNAQRMLLAGAEQVCRDAGASSLHITFLPRDEWEFVGKAGVLLRTDQQFHWHNNGYASFDDFLAALSSSKRKNLRKERAAVRDAGIEFEWLTGSTLKEEHWDRFFAFYMDTGGRKWGRPYLTREFFSRIGATMADQVLLIMARRGAHTIAGALNFMDSTALYGRNWGTTEYVPFLHFETCYYQAIDFAITHRLKRVEAGAQGAHKLLRGYLPTPTYSAHYIVHPGLRQAVADYLSRERVAAAEHLEQLVERAPFKKSAKHEADTDDL